VTAVMQPFAVSSAAVVDYIKETHFYNQLNVSYCSYLLAL